MAESSDTSKLTRQAIDAWQQTFQDALNRYLVTRTQSVVLQPAPASTLIAAPGGPPASLTVTPIPAPPKPSAPLAIAPLAFDPNVVFATDRWPAERKTLPRGDAAPDPTEQRLVTHMRSSNEPFIPITYHGKTQGGYSGHQTTRERPSRRQRTSRHGGTSEVRIFAPRPEDVPRLPLDVYRIQDPTWAYQTSTPVQPMKKLWLSDTDVQWYLNQLPPSNDQRAFRIDVVQPTKVVSPSLATTSTTTSTSTTTTSTAAVVVPPPLLTSPTSVPTPGTASTSMPTAFTTTPTAASIDLRSGYWPVDTRYAIPSTTTNQLNWSTTQ